jgi:hypothetical protein
MKPLFIVDNRSVAMLLTRVLPALAVFEASFTSANGKCEPCRTYYTEQERRFCWQHGKGKSSLHVEQLKCGFGVYLLVQHGRIILA